MDYGVASTAQLLAGDWTRSRIRKAVTEGHLTRLRRGWFAFPTADPAVARAVRVGGVLSCVSALKKHWVWVPRTTHLHVRPCAAAATIAPVGVRFCPTFSQQPSPKSALDSLPMALEVALRCLSFENRVVVIDSVLNRKLMHIADVRAIIGQLHGNHQNLLRAFDSKAESGTETMVRLRLRALGLQLTPQVPIANIGHVDLLVGERLVIEVDSITHHTSLEDYHNDRWRDLRLAALGYRVIRLSYHQVVFDWDEVVQLILSLITRGEHLWPAHP